MKQIFIVEDHPIIRQIYVDEISEASGLTVCGTAASFAEALEGLPKARPDLATVDIALGQEASDGLELIRQLAASFNGRVPRWLVVSAHDDQVTIQRAFEAGADEFISKRKVGDVLITTIREMLGE